MDRIAFGAKLRQARKDNQLTSEALANLCEVAPVFIRHIEAGNRLPSLSVFIKLCRELRTDPNYFLLDEIGKEISDEDQIRKMLSGLSGKKKRVVRQMVEILIHELEAEW